MPPTVIEKSLHYNGEVEILFYPNSHRYKLAGEKDYLIGVTTATGMLDKSRPLTIWATKLTGQYLIDMLNRKEPITEEQIWVAVNQHNEKRDEAAGKGTLVHKWAEAFAHGEALPVPEDEQVRNGTLAFLKWVKENDIRFVSNEKRVYSRKYKYVGTMDLDFTMGKDENHTILHPGDYKTASGIYPEMAFQVSAYQNAMTEEHGTIYGDKCIIRFDKETGEFHEKWFKREEHEGHFRAFLALLEVKKQMKVWDKLHNEYLKKFPQE